MQIHRIPTIFAFPAPLKAGLLCAGLALCTIASAQRGFPIADGIEVSIKPPAKWTFLGSQGDLGSLRAMFCAPRSYAPTEGRAAAHTPTLRLMWFGKPAAEEAAAKKSDFPMRTPYTDVKDYIARVNGPGGKIAAVEAGTFGKLQGRRYVVEFKRDVGSLTLHMCVIKMGEGEFVAEFEVLREQYKRMRGQFEKAFSTLAPTPPEKIKKLPEVEVPRWESDYESWKKLPKADREKHRQDWGRKFLAARTAAYEPGWKIVKNKNWLVLSRTDSKFTKRIVQAADIARKWVESKTGNVSDDIVMPAVLRIFDSQREETTFRLRNTLYNPNEYSRTRREIYAFKDASMGNLGDGYGGVVRGVFQQFVHDKHPKILANMPRWLDAGLWGLMDSTRVVKGKKLIFFPHEVEMGRFKYHKDHNTAHPIWYFTHEMIEKDPEDGAGEPAWGYTPECTRLLRWFDETGSEAVKQKDMLTAYLAAIGKAGETEPPDPRHGVDRARLTDDDVKKFNKAYYAWREKFLKKVNYDVMPFPQTAWPAISKAWHDWNAEFEKRKFKKK